MNTFQKNSRKISGNVECSFKNLAQKRLFKIRKISDQSCGQNDNFINNFTKKLLESSSGRVEFSFEKTVELFLSEFQIFSLESRRRIFTWKVFRKRFSAKSFLWTSRMQFSKHWQEVFAQVQNFFAQSRKNIKNKELVRENFSQSVPQDTWKTVFRTWDEYCRSNSKNFWSKY